MGVVANWLKAPSAVIANPMSDVYWTGVGLASQPTAAGVRVDPDTALKLSIVWACVRLISTTIAALPVILYEQVDATTKRRATDQPLWPVLHRQPNRYQSRFAWVETMMIHLLLRGNAYSEILPGPRGPFGELMPIHPDLIRQQALPDGTIVYKIRNPQNNTERTVNADDIFHIVGPSQDGRTGMSTIAYGAESFGLSLATDRYAGAFFGNGTRPGGTLTTTKALGREAKERLKQDWESLFRGVQSAFRVAVLEDGMSFQPVSISLEDAQVIAQREFNAEDVCRWFAVPPHLVGLTGKATSWGTGIGELTLGYMKFTVLGWLERWEGAIEQQLIVDPDRYFVEWLTASLERADIKTRYEAYEKAAGGMSPWLKRSEIRVLENLEPIDGLDEMLLPLTQGMADRPADPIPATPAPPPVEEPLTGAFTPGAHYRALVEDAAARIIRQEIAAVTKLAKKHADSQVEWLASMREFYAEHGERAATILHLSDAAVSRYVAEQMTELVLGGVAAMLDWETRRLAALIALVEEVNCAAA